MRGRLSEACSALEQAVAMLDGTISAGRTARSADKANALMNLGVALDRSGRHDEAVPHLRAALKCFDPALRRARRFGTVAGRMRDTRRRFVATPAKYV